MSLSITLTTDEQELVNEYAKNHSISVTEAFKTALLEKIEDDYDLAIAQKAYDDYVINGKKTRPIEELWAELDELDKLGD